MMDKDGRSRKVAAGSCIGKWMMGSSGIIITGSIILTTMVRRRASRWIVLFRGQRSGAVPGFSKSTYNPIPFEENIFESNESIIVHHVSHKPSTTSTLEKNQQNSECGAASVGLMAILGNV